MTEETFKKIYVTREEWEAAAMARKEKDAAAFARECDLREFLNEIKDNMKTEFKTIQDDVKSILLWQSQFKGGFKLLAGLVAFIGAVGGLVKIFWPKS
jgi:hypothetical protein